MDTRLGFAMVVGAFLFTIFFRSCGRRLFE